MSVVFSPPPPPFCSLSYINYWFLFLYLLYSLFFFSCFPSSRRSGRSEQINTQRQQNYLTTQSLSLRLLCGVRSIRSSLGRTRRRRSRTHTPRIDHAPNVFYWFLFSHLSFTASHVKWTSTTSTPLRSCTTTITRHCLPKAYLEIATQISSARPLQCSCPCSINQSWCPSSGPSSWVSADSFHCLSCQSTIPSLWKLDVSICHFTILVKPNPTVKRSLNNIFLN